MGQGEDLRGAAAPTQLETQSIEAIIIAGSQLRRARRVRRALALVVPVSVAALVVGDLLVPGGHPSHAQTLAQAATGNQVIGGHEVTYLPSSPYPLSFETGTCVGSSQASNRGCWAPRDLPQQKAYTVGFGPSMASTTLRLSFGPAEQYSQTETTWSQPQDSNTTVTKTTVKGAPALEKTSDGVVHLVWQIDSTSTASVIAFNIAADEIRRFAEGIK